MSKFFDPPLPEEEGVTPLDMQVIDAALGMDSGYVLDFNDKTFDAFVYRHFRIDVSGGIYIANGASKAKRLRAFIGAMVPGAQAEILQTFLNHRRQLERDGRLEPLLQPLADRFEAIVARLAANDEDGPNLEIERFSNDATLNQLVAAIERDIEANAPHAALDRLHTYCMRKFAALSEAAGLGIIEKETLNGRVGRYVNGMRRTGALGPIADKIAKSTVQIFEQFNDVRNNNSLAHDNELLTRAEGQYVLETVLSLLRFVRAIDGPAYGR